MTFLYIFLLVDCFKWALIDCKIHLVTFLYIFLLFDCFKWALIDCIEKHRVHSALWQFQTGGFVSFTRVNLKIWAHLPFDALLHRRSFRITYERPNNHIWTANCNIIQWHLYIQSDSYYIFILQSVQIQCSMWLFLYIHFTISVHLKYTYNEHLCT